MFVDLLYDGYFDLKKLETTLERYFLCVEQRSIRTERRFLDTSIAKDKIYDGNANNPDFGPHIIARIEEPTGVTLERLYDILDEMPSKINMNPICRPYVLKSSITNPRYLSGIVLIAQSHIAFHYDCVDKTLFCDLFSCSFYKIEQFEEYLKGCFGEFESMTIIRGSKHEHNIKNKEIKRRELSSWLENIDGEEE
jgi:S-adenosylmethionine/arginine decarboxylase-like enzyme